MEIEAKALGRQLAEKEQLKEGLERELRASQARLAVHRLAAQRLSQAEKTLAVALAARQRRADDERRLKEEEHEAEQAGFAALEAQRRLHDAEEDLAKLRRLLQAATQRGRETQARLNAVDGCKKLLEDEDKRQAQSVTLEHAEKTAERLEKLKVEARERPAPDDVRLSAMKQNRAEAARARAELDAAAITLTVWRDPDSPEPRIVVDGAPAKSAPSVADQPGSLYRIRHRAEIAIPGWGRADVQRGSDSRGLDQIEDNLGALDRQFAEQVAPFGVVPGDPGALDQLQALAADKKFREPELKRCQDELRRLAPDGLDALREHKAELERRIHARREQLGESAPDLVSLDPAQLDRLVAEFGAAIKADTQGATDLEAKIALLARTLEGTSEARSPAASSSKRVEPEDVAVGLRQAEAAAQRARPRYGRGPMRFAMRSRTRPPRPSSSAP